MEVDWDGLKFLHVRHVEQAKILEKCQAETKTAQMNEQIAYNNWCKTHEEMKKVLFPDA